MSLPIGTQMLLSSLGIVVTARCQSWHQHWVSNSFLKARDMRIDSQGQITIPSEIQEQLGLEPGTEVQLEVSNSALLIRPVRPARSGMELIESLRGKATAQFSTDQIMDLTRGDS